MASRFGGGAPKKPRFFRGGGLEQPPGAALFVTGTDTGVGKTWVTAALARALRAAGRSVGVVKPVETGWPAAQVGAAEGQPDGIVLRDAAGDGDPLDEIVPFRLAEPLAPQLAAERAGVAIDVDRIVELVGAKRRRRDVVLIEGAGGLLVPITSTVTTLDLIVRLGTPVLVVAANRLGVINHTALTLACLDQRAVPVAGVVLTCVCEGRDLAQATNPGHLSRTLGPRFLGELPRVRDPRDLDAAAHDLAAALGLLHAPA